MKVTMFDLATMDGYAFTCAMCNRLHEAMDRGLSGCMASHQGIECKGPNVGGGFPHYDGPIKDTMSSFCWKCGEESSGGVMSDGRLVGMCSEHLVEFRERNRD